jgi:hypothetical protein
MDLPRRHPAAAVESWRRRGGSGGERDGITGFAEKRRPKGGRDYGRSLAGSGVRADRGREVRLCQSGAFFFGYANFFFAFVSKVDITDACQAYITYAFF